MRWFTVPRLLFLLGGGVVMAGCAARSVPGEIKGEPVCADFSIGKNPTQMKGSLKKPVQVTILEDEDEVRWQRILLGRRKAEDPNFKFVIPDSDETYTIRWAQCTNEFAPKKVDLDERPEDVRLDYQCGEAKVYNEAKLEIREGDANSRVVDFVAPPEPTCWKTGGV